MVTKTASWPSKYLKNDYKFVNKFLAKQLIMVMSLIAVSFHIQWKQLIS